MNIKYRLSKEELYDMILYTLCGTKFKKFNYICSDLAFVILLLGSINFFLLEYNPGVSNVIKLIIALVSIIITIGYGISVVRLKGLILNYNVKYFFEPDFINMCDTDITIKLTESKIIINKNDNELISPVSDIRIKVRNDKFMQIKVDFQSLYIPCSAFDDIADKETFIKIIQSI